ncbi:MAG: cyclodeaminase/cyclohydrolase family protein, partial [Bacteroidales bacterium]|nr:cyclodeaminase/cyclohydrolase family protein [Bacteroidales bacterium]
VMGAWLNVRINASSLKDRDFADKVLAEAKQLAEQAMKTEAEILKMADEKIG